jgi:hypothetical protein
MATSSVDICNLALDKINSTRITSLDNPKTVEEKICALHYDQTRREALADAIPIEARKRVFLPKNTDAPIFGFGFAYTLPTDILIPIGVNDIVLNADYSYTVEGDLFMCDDDFDTGLPLRYIVDEENVTKLSRNANFIKFWYTKFAEVIANPIKGIDQETENRLKKDVQLALLACNTTIGRSDKPVLVDRSIWQQRYSGNNPQRTKK